MYSKEERKARLNGYTVALKTYLTKYIKEKKRARAIQRVRHATTKRYLKLVNNMLRESDNALKELNSKFLDEEDSDCDEYSQALEVVGGEAANVTSDMKKLVPWTPALIRNWATTARAEVPNEKVKRDSLAYDTLHSEVVRAKNMLDVVTDFEKEHAATYLDTKTDEIFYDFPTPNDCNIVGAMLPITSFIQS